MKKLLVIIASMLFPVACLADVEYVHNFHNMLASSKIAFYNGNKTGKTDTLVYTCFDGSASFSYNARTSSRVCLFLAGKDAIATTSMVADLDSLNIFYYYPASADTPEKRVFYVQTSTDSISWTLRTVVQRTAGVSTVQLPSKGDYYVRFLRKDYDIYLSQIKYITKPCHCLRVVSE